MSSFKTVFRHSSYLFGSKLFTRILYTVFVLYAAAVLGPAIFGALTFSLAMVDMVSSISDLGITRYGTRELIRKWDNRAIISGQIFAIQMLSSLILGAGGLLVLLIVRPDAPKMQLLLLAMVSVFFTGFISTTESSFAANQDFFFSALFTFIGRLVFIAIGFTALVSGMSVVFVMWGFLFGILVEASLRIVLQVKRITPFSFSYPVRDLYKMLVAALPFAINMVAGIVFLQINIIALGILKDDAAVGVYGVAFAIYMPIMWVPVILARTTFPVLAGKYKDDITAAKYQSWQWYRLIALVGMPVAILITFLAGPALSHYPGVYEESVTILKIIAWSVPLMLIAAIEINILQLIDQEKAGARAVTVAAIVNTSLCFILIPFFGVVGAAIALLVGAVAREVQVYHEVRKHFLKRHAAVLFLRPVVAGLAMGAVSLLLGWVNPWLASGLGFVTYIVVIFLLGGVSYSELKILLRK